MDEKFYRFDGDFFGVIENEDGTYNVGEFTEHSADAYWVYELSLPSVEVAKKVCEAMVEVFNDGRNSCECF